MNARAIETGTSAEKKILSRSADFGTSEQIECTSRGCDFSISEVTKSTPLEVPESASLNNKTNINNIYQRNCGGELVERKYISNSLWNDSLLVKYSEFGYNDACISSRADC